jgi:hypothetical protein
LPVDDFLKQCEKFEEKEEWDNLARLVALLRTQIRTPTQKSVLENLEAKIADAASELLNDAANEEPGSPEHVMALQEVIDIDPTCQAAASALKELEAVASRSRLNKLSAKQQRMPYSAEQAVGAPNAQLGKEDPNAWAPKSMRSQPEWLLLDFGRPIAPESLEIHESFHPGAVSLIEVSNDGNRVTQIMASSDPSANARVPSAVTTINADRVGPIRYVKLTLSPHVVNGLCQIDAVAIVETTGQKTWAVAAEASSVYTAD